GGLRGCRGRAADAEGRDEQGCAHERRDEGQAPARALKPVCHAFSSLPLGERLDNVVGLISSPSRLVQSALTSHTAPVEQQDVDNVVIPARAPTMRDVAAVAGVSLKTVSRVVNQETGV